MDGWIWDVLGGAGLVVACLALWVASKAATDRDIYTLNVIQDLQQQYTKNQVERIGYLEQRADEYRARITQLENRAESPSWPIQHTPPSRKPEVRNVERE